MNTLIVNALSICALAGSALALADNNPLLDRTFWQQASAEQLQQTLAAGHSPTDISANSYTPLLLAAQNGGSPELIDLLIDAGAQVDRIGHDGRTALFYAAHSGSLAMVNAVLSYQPDIAVRDQSGRTALLFAFSKQTDLAVFDRLIGVGLDPAAIDSNGRNAALIAVQRAVDPEVLDYLVRKEFDLNLIDTDGRDLRLNTAYRNENLAMVKKVWAMQGRIVPQDGQGQNAILLAAYRNANPEVLQFLLEQGVSATAQDSQGNTALTIAVERNNLAIIDWLLSANLELNQRNQQGETALLIAAGRRAENDQQQQSNRVILERLIDAGARVDLRSNNGNSVLINAVRSHQGYDTLEYLLSQGAPINPVNTDQLSALMVAAMVARDTQVISLLLAKGGNVQQSDDFGDTALELIGDNDALAQTAAVQWLVEAQAN